MKASTIVLILAIVTIVAIVLLAVFVESAAAAAIGTAIFTFIMTIIGKLIPGGGNANPPAGGTDAGE